MSENAILEALDRAMVETDEKLEKGQGSAEGLLWRNILAAKIREQVAAGTLVMPASGRITWGNARTGDELTGLWHPSGTKH